jgi:hypothetical protein
MSLKAWRSCSSATNPMTASLSDWAFPAILGACVVLAVWRCLLPQSCALVQLWREWRRLREAERRHGAEMEFRRRKERENQGRKY